jgi:enamine deaminase RidA (YjgF/YER057c/UK114 family)
MKPEDRLRELGIALPDLPTPLGSYVPFVQTGNLIFISGMLPLKDGKLIASGRVGESVLPDDAVSCARMAAINGLAVLRSAIGRLDRVQRCVKVTAFVASAQDFIEQPRVVNGASDFLFEVFGDTGKHARVAVGVQVLPMNAPVEIDFIFETLPA